MCVCVCVCASVCVCVRAPVCMTYGAILGMSSASLPRNWVGKDGWVGGGGGVSGRFQVGALVDQDSYRRDHQ